MSEQIQFVSWPAMIGCATIALMVLGLVTYYLYLLCSVLKCKVRNIPMCLPKGSVFDLAAKCVFLSCTVLFVWFTFCHEFWFAEINGRVLELKYIFPAKNVTILLNDSTFVSVEKLPKGRSRVMVFCNGAKYTSATSSGGEAELLADKLKSNEGERR